MVNISIFRIPITKSTLDKEKIVNALQLPYSNAKLETTNNLIKLIKQNAFGFRNFEGSIIFVVGKSPMDLMEPFLL